jgi:hypothetical protein
LSDKEHSKNGAHFYVLLESSQNKAASVCQAHYGQNQN